MLRKMSIVVDTPL